VFEEKLAVQERVVREARAANIEELLLSEDSANAREDLRRLLSHDRGTPASASSTVTPFPRRWLGGRRGRVVALVAAGGAAVIAATIALILGLTHAGPKNATLTITSQPPGASVYVDGEKSDQRTPAGIELKRGESYTIKVAKDGYEPWRGEVRIGPDREGETLAVTLRRLGTGVGILKIYTGALVGPVAVYLDGRRVAEALPATIPEVPAGVEHFLHIEAEGFAPADLRVTPERDQVKSVEAVLRPLAEEGSVAWVAVHTTPPGAAVWVDGVPAAGKTPLERVRVPVGREVRLAIVLEGHEGYARSVRLGPGESPIYEIALRPLGAGDKGGPGKDPRKVRRRPHRR